MPQYPPQQTPASQTENQTSGQWITKQIAIGIISIIALAIGWWYIFVLQEGITQLLDFSSNTNSLIQIFIITIAVYTLILTILSLIALIIQNNTFKYIAATIPTLAYFFANHYPTLQNNQFLTLISAALTAIAMIVSIIFIINISKEQKIYRKFSFTRLVLPHTNFLFLTVSIILTFPLYLHLRQNPDHIPNLIKTRLTASVVDNLITSTTPGTGNNYLQNTSQFITSLPETISDLFESELTSKMRSQLSLNPSAGPENQLANPVDNPPTLQPDNILLTNTVQSQIEQFINPLTPYLPLTISLLIFFTLFQATSILKPIIIFFPWLMFKLLLTLKIVKIITRDEPVEILET